MRREGASILSYVLSKLLRWHPIYVYSNYSKTPGRPYVPFTHQVIVLRDNLSRPTIRILIGDEVGLGKTAQAALTLRLIEERLKLQGRDPRILILVPRILVEQWYDELVYRAAVDFNRVYLITSGNDVNRLESSRWPPGYYIGSIQLLRLRDHPERLEAVDWDAIVVDEAHNVGIGPRIREPNKSYLLVFKLTRPPHRSVILLSATPHRGKSRDYIARLLLLVPLINLDDLRKLVTELDRADFYKKTHGTMVYRRTKELVNKLEGKNIFPPAHLYAVIIKVSREEEQFENILRRFIERKIDEWGSEIWRTGNPKGLLIALILKRASSSTYAACKTLTTIIKGFQERLGAEVDIEKLSKVLSIGFEELTEDPEEIIEAVIRSSAGFFTARDVEELKKLINIAKKIEEKGEAKLEALRDLIRLHVMRGKRVVVFTEYKDTLEYLYKNLKGLEIGGKSLNIACISGAQYGECSRQNIELVKQKLASGEIDVLLATDVASEGLNLQYASVLVNYDVPWSPVKLEQRIGRIWRLGQHEEVQVYSLFRNTYVDLMLIEKLYAKIMAIQTAMGTSRPIIGSKAEIYAEGRFYSIDEFYRGGAPGSSDAVANVLEEEGEVGIARAIIEGKLDEIAEKIIERINRLRREIQEKRIYPIHADPDTLKKIISRCLGVKDTPINTIISQAKRLRKIVGRSEPRDLYESIIAFKGVLAWLASKSQANISRTYKTPALAPGAKLVIIPLRIKAGNNILYEELVGVELSPNKRFRILVGPELLDKVLEIVEKGVEQYQGKPLSGLERSIILMKAKAFLEKCLQISYTTDQYNSLWSILVEKMDDKSDTLTIPGIVIEPNEAESIVIVHGELERKAETETEETTSQPVDRASVEELEERLRIEREALKVVMKYELDHGRIPKDVHEEKSYDIESYDAMTGQVVRYIEVKAHRGSQAVVELTEKEYEFAKRHRDKYWLYIVLNVGSPKPKIIAIQDPLSKLKFKPCKKKVVEERVETRYTANVDISIADEMA